MKIRLFHVSYAPFPHGFPLFQPKSALYRLYIYLYVTGRIIAAVPAKNNIEIQCKRGKRFDKRSQQTGSGNNTDPVRIFRKGAVFYKARILRRERRRLKGTGNNYCSERRYAPCIKTSQKQNSPCAEHECRRLRRCGNKRSCFFAHIIFLSFPHIYKSFSSHIRRISVCPKHRYLCREEHIGDKNRCFPREEAAHAASFQP